MFYEELLQRIGKNLELSKNKFESLKHNYEALARFISSKHSLSSQKGSIYTQGSFAIDTAIKPLKYGEFDVDVVIEFGQAFLPGLQVSDFYEKMRSIFQESRYDDKIEEYKNVIRINYQGDYHFDIMPSLPNPNKPNGHIKCVDTKKSKWQNRSPKLYRNWFVDIAGSYQISHVNNFDFQLQEMNTKSFDKQLDYERKPTLIRAVQLVKRARDVFFEDEMEHIPQSIVLTTMIATLYENENNTKDFLLKLAKSFNQIVSENKEFDVKNPVPDSDENFTDKWKVEKEFYYNFRRFSLWFNYKMNNILHNDNHKHVMHHIETTFGRSIPNKLKDDNFMLISSYSHWKPKQRLVNDILVENDYNLRLEYPIVIKAKYIDADTTKTLKFSDDTDNIFYIQPDAKIQFSLASTKHIRKSFKYVWKIRNMVGNETNHEVRGDIKENEIIDERLSFSGPHFVECYLVCKGVVIAYERINVNLI